MGVYRIGDPTDPYWETTGFFGGSPLNKLGDGTQIVDELFTGTEAPVLSIPLGRPVASVDYPLSAEQVRLANVPALVRELETLGADASIEGVALNDRPAAKPADRGERQRAAITAAVPTVALPLIVLCWFVLFLVVAAVTDDRRAEIAVGKLRGLSVGGITRFAVGEPLLLIALAAPLGLLLGIGLTNLAAGAFLAPGVDVQVGWPAMVVGLGALLGAVGRRRARRPPDRAGEHRCAVAPRAAPGPPQGAGGRGDRRGARPGRALPASGRQRRAARDAGLRGAGAGRAPRRPAHRPAARPGRPPAAAPAPPAEVGCPRCWPRPRSAAGRRALDWSRC